MNSDPIMVASFLKLLRQSFNLDESKFRVLIHLHEYHNEAEILDYWSKVTQISRSQFTKSYHKPHTGTNNHPDYKGSCKIKYYDSYLAKLLTVIYQKTAQSITSPQTE
jgi:hypothetical protein